MPYYASNRITGSTTAVAKTGSLQITQPNSNAYTANNLFCEQATIIFPSGVNPAANDVIEMLVLPADHVMVDFLLYNDDFDTGTNLMQARIGLMSGSPGDSSRLLATVGSDLLAAAVTPWTSAAGFVRMSTGVVPFQVAPATTDRSIGIGVTVSPNASPASNRRIDLLLWYRPARYGS